MPEAAGAAARAFGWACALDVGARKPGNVSWASPGHGMAAPLFIASARVAAPALAQPGERVGARIEAAMRATLAAAGCNTNLGIVLLAAPLLAAQEAAHASGAPLADALAAVLAALDVADAQAAFRAIALTQPAGLGRVEAADVHAPAQVSLAEAMRLAAHRDRIARQYAQGYAEVFALGVPAFQAGWRAAQAWPEAVAPARVARHAMLCAYLAWLADGPDSHIARKHGDSAAHTVNAQARPWAARAAAGERLDTDPTFAAWDEALKRRGLNPGSCADLAVASALVAALLQPALAATPDPGAALA